MKRVVIMAVALTLLLVACQPTPEKEIVIQRDNTEKKVVESVKAAPEEVEFQYETPDHIDDRFAVIEDKLDILIDADVNMPDIDSVPVAKVRSNLFTQEKADQLREFFMKDGKLVSEYVLTKSDYDDMIIDAKRGHEVDGEMVFDESSQQWLDQLIKEREKAPEEDTKNLITDYSIDGEKGLNGRVIVKGKEIGSLYINKEDFCFYSEKPYRLSMYKQYDDKGNLIEQPTIDIKMTEEEAVAIAHEHLESMGIEGMAVKDIDKAYFLNGYGRNSKADFGGYYIEFMREFGGMMPINIKGYGMRPEDNFDVSPPVDMELMTVLIDDGGHMHSFTWRNPIEIVDVLTEHVDILTFEDIIGRLRDFTKIHWAYISEYYSEVMWVKKIIRIDFSLSYLPIKNNPTEFMYAPCWCFVYKDLSEYTDEQLKRMQENGMYPANEDEMGEDYIIFSAVDGASVSAYSTKAFEEVQRMREVHEDD